MSIANIFTEEKKDRLIEINDQMEEIITKLLFDLEENRDIKDHDYDYYEKEISKFFAKKNQMIDEIIYT